MNTLCVITFLVSFAQACMTSGDGEEIKLELFRAHKRLLELEHRLDKSGKEVKSKGDQANQRIASASVRQDRLDGEIRQIKGSLDILRRGVITGELPGNQEQADSVAKTLRILGERIVDLEKTQIEILTLLENKRSKKNEKNRKKRKNLNNLSDIKKAFDNKNYLYIAEDASKIIKRTKKAKDKLDLRFYYAESLFKLGRLRDSALLFNELLNEESLGQKALVRLRMGDSFRLLGDKKAAEIYYHEVISDFPNSEEAEVAQKHVKKKISPRNS